MGLSWCPRQALWGSYPSKPLPFPWEWASVPKLCVQNQIIGLSFLLYPTDAFVSFIGFCPVDQPFIQPGGTRPLTPDLPLQCSFLNPSVSLRAWGHRVPQGLLSPGDAKMTSMLSPSSFPSPCYLAFLLIRLLGSLPSFLLWHLPLRALWPRVSCHFLCPLVSPRLIAQTYPFA